MQNQSGFVAVEVLVLCGDAGAGTCSVASGSSSTGSLCAGSARAVSAGAVGWELTAGTGSTAADSCDAVEAGVDLSIEITDSLGAGGEDGERETGSFEPGSGSVPASVPGPAVDDAVTFESRIVNAVVVSASVPVRGAVPASGGAVSP